jgi:hypothetical protein
MRSDFSALMMRVADKNLPDRSRVQMEIKKKIRRVCKISCEILLTEFISSVFGGFTSNVVFDFFGSKSSDVNPNSHEQGI